MRQNKWFMVGLLVMGLLLAACSPAEEQTPSPDEVISQAVQQYLSAQGSQTDQFEVQLQQMDGDYARVTVISTDPAVPGGFTGFLQFKDGAWTTLLVGSDFNPMEVQGLGIPQSILPEGWVLPDSAEVTSGEGDCPAGSAEMQSWGSETRSYCMLVPAAYTVLQPNENMDAFVIGSIMNHTDPRVEVTVEDAAGRTLEQVADDFVTGYPGFEISRSTVMLDGQEAILLDKIPGQDYYRLVFVIHDGRLYRLDFFPFDEGLGEAAYNQAVQLYDIVVDSFRFVNA